MWKEDLMAFDFIALMGLALLAGPLFVATLVGLLHVRRPDVDLFTV